MLGGIAFQLREYLPYSSVFIIFYTEIFIYLPVVIIVYTFCAGEFFVRYLWKRPIRAPESSEYYEDASETTKYDSNGRGEMGHKMQLMVVALCFSTLCLLIR